MKEIARRLVGNVWRTGVVEEDGNGGSQPILVSAPIPVSAAELLAINTSSKTLLATPSAGTMWWVWHVFMALNFNTTPYVQADALQVGVAGDSQNIGGSTFLQSTGDRITAQFGSYDVLGNGANADPAVFDGAAFVLSSASNPTGGDSPLEITVWYSLITLP